MKNKLFYRSFSISLILMVVFATLCVANVTVNAAVSYKGRGTKSDPYLVYTAEQLDGMRNKLSSHYKLMNTIDLSSYGNFNPIGKVSDPFKGTFICDLDASGKPLYCIKNMKMTVEQSEYKEDGSCGWGCGLFGAALGSTFKNILVLDANVVCNIKGGSQMNSDYSINKGVDEQGSAILLGIGCDITMSGCGVSGKITSINNCGASLIGMLTKKLVSSDAKKTVLLSGKKSGTITNCYSYATVNAQGAWNTAGLIASCGDATITGCFYSGEMQGGWRNVGGLVGAVGKSTKISNCYTEGLVSQSSLIGYNPDNQNAIRGIDVCTNCWTSASIRQKTALCTEVSEIGKKTGNYISKECKGLEYYFSAADMATINQAFASIDGWVTSTTDYPRIKGLVPVKTGSGYNVNTIVEEDTKPSDSDDESKLEETNEAEENTDDNSEKSDSNGTVETVIDQTKTGVSKSEWALIITYSVLAALLFIGTTVILVLNIRFIRNAKKVIEQKSDEIEDI